MYVIADRWYVVLSSAELGATSPVAARRLGLPLVFWRARDGQPQAAKLWLCDDPDIFISQPYKEAAGDRREPAICKRPPRVTTCRQTRRATPSVADPGALSAKPP